MPQEPPITTDEFSDLFRESYPTVLYWFQRRGFDHETSRELAQDTFLAAYKGLDFFRREASFKTWILHIARNVYRNHLRDQGALKRSGSEVSLTSHEGETGEGTLQIADAGATHAEEVILETEGNEKLRHSLSSLPPQMRQCVELRLADLKYREIATIMNVSLETVKSHLHQARQRLRKSLGDDSGSGDERNE